MHRNLRHRAGAPRLLALAAALLALFAAGGLSACFHSGEDAGEVLDETFSGGKQVRSGRLAIDLVVNLRGVAGLTGPITVKLGGPFQSEGPRTLPRFDFDLSLAAAGQQFTAGATSTGDQGFIALQGTDYALPQDVFNSFKQGYEQSQQAGEGSEQNPSLASLGIDPRNWLSDAEVEGDEQVAGAETTHVSAQVDVPALLRDINQLLQRAGSLGASEAQLPTQLTDAQIETVADAITEASLDVWSGTEDRTLRRLTLTLDFEIPEAARAATGGAEGGRIDFSVEIADLNSPQQISAPTDPRPFSQLVSALQGGLGGLLGAGGAGAGGAAGSENLDAYSQCIQEAAGDIRAQQECARLLAP